MLPTFSSSITTLGRINLKIGEVMSKEALPVSFAVALTVSHSFNLVI